MITHNDWLKIEEFAETPKRVSLIEPWGWESEYALPDTDELLKFIKEKIGIKEHINVHIK